MVPTATIEATDPADLSVLEAAAALRSRSLSAVELLDAVQRRIAARNGGPPTFDGASAAINAWVRLYPERAAEQARAADARLAREGADAPALCGIPIGLKDVFGVAGLPVTASSRVLEGHVAAGDSVAWARLRRRGMVLVGHTHMHEFAAGGTTDQVANPWAPDRSPGGSSGGSAAAVAAGMIAATLGTDTCGSLRIPAAACGVSTIKPTHGRVPIDGLIPMAPSLDHPGPIARTIADCAVLLQGLADDGAQPTPLTAPPAAMGTLATQARPGPRPLAGVRIALTDRTRDAGVDDDVAEGLDAARQACERLGATVLELTAAPGATIDDLNRVSMTEALAYHARHAGRRDRYRPSIREVLDDSASFTGAAEYLDAQERRAAVTAGWDDWFAHHRVDAILEPTIPIVAPVRGGGYDTCRLDDDDPLIRLTAAWTMTGRPAVSLPAGLGRRSRLPVGVSLIAPRGAEAALVRIALDLQAHALPVALAPR